MIFATVSFDGCVCVCSKVFMRVPKLENKFHLFCYGDVSGE